MATMNPTRTRLVVELHPTQSHRSSLLRKREPSNPRDRGTAAVFDTLGYWIPAPYQVRGDVFSPEDGVTFFRRKTGDVPAPEGGMSFFRRRSG